VEQGRSYTQAGLHSGKRGLPGKEKRVVKQHLRPGYLEVDRRKP
jgi:hypothetical protein